jgi:hypothetical protein
MKVLEGLQDYNTIKDMKFDSSFALLSLHFFLFVAFTCLIPLLAEFIPSNLGSLSASLSACFVPPPSCQLSIKQSFHIHAVD